MKKIFLKKVFEMWYWPLNSSPISSPCNSALLRGRPEQKWSVVIILCIYINIKNLDALWKIVKLMNRRNLIVLPWQVASSESSPRSSVLFRRETVNHEKSLWQIALYPLPLYKNKNKYYSGFEKKLTLNK